jgi:hypothetical protein
MFIAPKSGPLLLALSVLVSGITAFRQAPSAPGQSSPAAATQATPDQNPQPLSQNGVRNAEVPDVPDEPPEDELAPAAVEIDVSHESPLLQVLYKATRETKEKETLARLQEAKALIQSDTDLKAIDPQGRTALHWAIFGSSYSTKPSVTVAYEEIADAMIQRGIDINHEDIYQDTALDYLLYSPSFEMQTLLMENGATSGFLVASFRFFDQMALQSPAANVPKAVSMSRRADFAPGATLSVRLTTPVYSDRSRTGDPIEGVVTYPLCKDGEKIACKDASWFWRPAQG